MRSPLPWLGALLGLYLTVPLLAFLLRLGRGREQLESTPGLGSAISVSVQTATISTLIIAVLGLPLAYVLSRGRGRTSGVVGILLQLPLAFPPLVSGLLLLYLVGPYTTLGDLFNGQLTDNRVGIVLAQVFVSAPFAVIAARSAFTALDPGWEDVAATLGHGRLARFLRVALPAAAPGIGAGLLLSWLRAFGEFGATVLLAYQPHSIPVLTYIQFGSTGLTGTTGPVLATLLISLVVVAGVPLLARLRWPVTAPVEPVPPAQLPAGAPGPVVSLNLDARLGSFHLRAGYAPAGRHVAVIGPSGSGKTMTLRLLAGLLPAGGSRVDFDGTDVSAVRAEQRGVGYVPQEPTLLPHLRLWQQVTFAVDADPRRAAYWLHRLGLTGLERRFPHERSGGQRRRVAIVRALAHSPRLL
ncbi:MAG TPA: ATP-binding cassette domain-containing protein, partial [Mycobacteriales bacterium]|nr:ATP-binding cassette domain-containing protein [Mycobacteriales bacterium]